MVASHGGLLKISARMKQDSLGVEDLGQVTIEVRNTGDDTGPLELEVSYYDSNGRPRGKDVVSIGGLSRGASSHFKSPPRPDLSVADFSIYLNHGRNPYGN